MTVSTIAAGVVIIGLNALLTLMSKDDEDKKVVFENEK